MTDIEENTNTIDAPSSQPKPISTILHCYRDNFWLFWRIMMPVVIFAFLFDIGMYLLTSLDSETLWHFDTARGLYVSETPKSTGTDTGMIFSLYSFSIGWLWFTMCPLILAIVERRQGRKVSSRGVWQRTGSQTGTILTTGCLLWLLVVPGVLAFFILTWKGIDVPVGHGFSSFPLSAFGDCSCLYLFHSKLEFSTIRALSLKVSNQQLHHFAAAARWFEVYGDATFRMYLLCVLVIMIFTSTILGLTLLVFSLTVPEFAPLREVLLSAKFLTLFCGGYARISFAEVPNFWTVGVMAMVNTLIHAIVAPVWAILTTYLYLERTGVQADVIETDASDSVETVSQPRQSSLTDQPQPLNND